jgi:hypothetical protein
VGIEHYFQNFLYFLFVKTLVLAVNGLLWHLFVVPSLINDILENVQFHLTYYGVCHYAECRCAECGGATTSHAPIKCWHCKNGEIRQLKHLRPVEWHISYKNDRPSLLHVSSWLANSTMNIFYVFSTNNHFFKFCIVLKSCLHGLNK